MDPTALLSFPDAPSDVVAPHVADIDAAIALVARGLATRVRLVALDRPEAAAAVGLAHAQEAGVRFRLDRGPDGIAITVGPLG